MSDTDEHFRRSGTGIEGIIPDDDGRDDGRDISTFDIDGALVGIREGIIFDNETGATVGDDTIRGGIIDEGIPRDGEACERDEVLQPHTGCRLSRKAVPGDRPPMNNGSHWCPG